jgi:hypothetical protein
MGITYRPRNEFGHQIRDFWPDDTDTVMYIAGDETLENILADILNKWEGASAANITISAEKIHTRCLDYDLYDGGDYTDFIVIRRTPGA